MDRKSRGSFTAWSQRAIVLRGTQASLRGLWRSFLGLFAGSLSEIADGRFGEDFDDRISGVMCVECVLLHASGASGKEQKPAAELTRPPSLDLPKRNPK